MTPRTPHHILSLTCVLVALAAVGVGCGSADDPDQGDREAIESVLAELRQAQDAGDAETACRDVYVIAEPERGVGEGEPAGPEGSEESPAESEEGTASESGAEKEGDEAGTEECEAGFRAAYARRRHEVRGLTTDVGEIQVDGDRATAIVHTELRRADGSTLRQDVPYDLLRTSGGWRIRISEEG